MSKWENMFLCVCDLGKVTVHYFKLWFCLSLGALGGSVNVLTRFPLS